MTTIYAALDARDRGQFPVSIGTSLALEGAFGIYPERPDLKATIPTVGRVWFNLRTLLRNMVSCLSTQDRDRLTPKALYTALLEEIQILDSLLPTQTNGAVHAQFYYCTHIDAPRKFPHAILKVPKTPLQKQLHDLEQKTYKLLIDSGLIPHLFLFDTELNGVHPASLILTHYPVDLLSRYKFAKLSLLESHTGVTKKPALWYTKLNGCKDATTIPFTKFTLQIFGDGSLFAGSVPGIRKRVMELSEQHHWTNVTTDDKIRFTLNRINDLQERVFLTSFL